MRRSSARNKSSKRNLSPKKEPRQAQEIPWSEQPDFVAITGLPSFAEYAEAIGRSCLNLASREDGPGKCRWDEHHNGTDWVSPVDDESEIGVVWAKKKDRSGSVPREAQHLYVRKRWAQRVKKEVYNMFQEQIFRLKMQARETDIQFEEAKKAHIQELAEMDKRCQQAEAKVQTTIQELRDSHGKIQDNRDEVKKLKHKLDERFRERVTLTDEMEKMREKITSHEDWMKVARKSFKFTLMYIGCHNFINRYRITKAIRTCYQHWIKIMIRVKGLEGKLEKEGGSSEDFDKWKRTKKTMLDRFSSKGKKKPARLIDHLMVDMDNYTPRLLKNMTKLDRTVEMFFKQNVNLKEEGLGYQKELELARSELEKTKGAQAELQARSEKLNELQEKIATDAEKMEKALKKSDRKVRQVKQQCLKLQGLVSRIKRTVNQNAPEDTKSKVASMVAASKWELHKEGEAQPNKDDPDTPSVDVPEATASSSSPPPLQTSQPSPPSSPASPTSRYSQDGFNLDPDEPDENGEKAFEVKRAFETPKPGHDNGQAPRRRPASAAAATRRKPLSHAKPRSSGTKSRPLPSGAPRSMRNNFYSNELTKACYNQTLTMRSRRKGFNGSGSKSPKRSLSHAALRPASAGLTRHTSSAKSMTAKSIRPHNGPYPNFGSFILI